MPVLCLLFPRLPVQVALRQRPQLAGRPFAVLDGAGEQSPVIAASPAAAAAGILAGMDAGNARRRCPAALFLPSNIGACFEALDAIVEILRLRATPRVAIGGHDHIFVDLDGVTTAAMPPAVAASRIAGLARSWSGFEVRAGLAGTAPEALLAARACRKSALVAVEPGDAAADASLPATGGAITVRATLAAGGTPAAARAAMHRLLHRLGAVLQARNESLRTMAVRLEDANQRVSEIRHRPRNPVYDPSELIPAIAAHLDDHTLARAVGVTIEAGGLVPWVPVLPASSAAPLHARSPRQLLRAG